MFYYFYHLEKRGKLAIKISSNKYIAYHKAMGYKIFWQNIQTESKKLLIKSLRSELSKGFLVKKDWQEKLDPSQFFFNDHFETKDVLFPAIKGKYYEDTKNGKDFFN